MSVKEPCKIEISGSIRNTVIHALGSFNVDMTTFMGKLFQIGFSRNNSSDIVLNMSEKELSIFKAIIQSQKEAILQQLQSLDRSGNSTATLTEHYNQMLQDLEQIKFAE